MFNNNWKKTLLKRNSTIRQAIRSLEKSTLQIVLITNLKNNLVGTITDGDIRRGLLGGLNINSPIKSLINSNPLVGSESMGVSAMKQILQLNKIQQLTILDKKKIIVGMYVWDAAIIVKKINNHVVIMAGGKGKRMLPFTKKCPKPLLPLAGKPVLEHIIIKAKSEGFINFVLSINYLGHMIKDFFGDGRKWGVKIKYLKEKTALGTAGSLSLFKNQTNSPFIVCNGDVISDIRFSDVLDFHVKNKAFVTIAVKPYELKNPYGVVKVNGNQITGIKEKPITTSHINTGVYVFGHKLFKNLKKDKYLDMDVLTQSLLKKTKKILAYSAYEPWLDVGQPKDFKKAIKKIKK
jgi:dTDP-glucose pyrophosphorylase